MNIDSNKFRNRMVAIEHSEEFTTNVELSATYTTNRGEIIGLLWSGYAEHDRRGIKGYTFRPTSFPEIEPNSLTLDEEEELLDAFENFVVSGKYFEVYHYYHV